MVDPVEVIYGGLDQLGPGDDASTRQVLGLLPRSDFGRVVDVGCGTGRQTLVLARALEAVIHALDSHQPFLDLLERRAAAAGLAERVQVHCMDMADLASVFRDLELLWAEGSAYNLGFANALATWAPAMAPGGCLVASELSWLGPPAPDPVRAFWQGAYPGMGSVKQNSRAAATAGYRVLDTYLLPRESWLEGYYDMLGPRARSLLHHEHETVRAMAAENLREIEIFHSSEGSYGYVFYLLQRP